MLLRPPFPTRTAPRSAIAQALAAAMALVGASRSQDPPSWPELQRSLETSTSSEERIAKLRSFLTLRGDQPDVRRSDDVLAARLRLGGLYLARFEADRAAAEFEIVAELARREAVDLRGSGHYGAAQAAELRDERERAVEHYELLVRDFAGTRYADYARVALRRLQTPSAARPRVGSRAPEFGPVLDTQGVAHRIADLRGRAALLVFTDPTDADSRRLVDGWLSAARREGVEADAIIQFAIAAPPATEPPADGAVRIATVVPANDFLSPPFLAFAVRSVPSNALIGPDGVLLGRDLPARRIRELLAALRNG